VKTKVKLTIEQAVSRYLFYKSRESKADFSKFVEEMDESYGSKFRLEYLDQSYVDFITARLAIDCHNIRFIYPEEIASKILKQLLKGFTGNLNSGIKKHYKAEFHFYSEIMLLYDNGKEEARQIGYARIAEKFLKEILGVKLNQFMVESHSHEMEISPVFTRLAVNLLNSSKLNWEGLSKRADIV
jgi:hypothetical protein